MKLYQTQIKYEERFKINFPSFGKNPWNHLLQHENMKNFSYVALCHLASH